MADEEFNAEGWGHVIRRIRELEIGLKAANQEIEALKRRLTMAEDQIGRNTDDIRNCVRTDVLNGYPKFGDLANYVKYGQEINLKSFEGFLASYMSGGKDELAVLIHASPSHHTRWKVDWIGKDQG